PVEPMTPEALALHFIDDLDSKLNQLRASREAATASGMQYHRGLGRFVYLPAAPIPEDLLAQAEAAEIEAISAEPHELEMREQEMPPEAEEPPGMPEAEEVQETLFRGE